MIVTLPIELLAMRKQRQPLPDTHCLHATTRVETAQFEGFRALILTRVPGGGGGHAPDTVDTLVRCVECLRLGFPSTGGPHIWKLDSDSPCRTTKQRGTCMGLGLAVVPLPHPEWLCEGCNAQLCVTAEGGRGREALVLPSQVSLEVALLGPKTQIELCCGSCLSD